MFPQIRRIFLDNTYSFPEDDGFRHEMKYTLTQYEHLRFRDFCSGFMDCDVNAGENGEYTVKSYYFDTPYYDDYAEKLNGIHDRKKYRIRTYSDKGYYKLEKKVKRGNRNKKITGDISAAHADKLIQGQTDLKTGEENTDAIISEMRMSGCRCSTYIEYSRQAFMMKEFDLRITFDKDLGALYGNYGLGEAKPGLIPVYHDGEAILEIKFKDTLPGWVEKAAHQMVPSSRSISKYAESLRGILR